MKHIKTKIMKALALVLSMTFLLAFPPVSMYAEPLPAQNHHRTSTAFTG